MYVPVYVPKTKRGSAILLYVVAAIFLALGVFAGIHAGQVRKTPVYNMDSVSSTELQKKTAYRIDELFVVDAYANSSTDSKVTAIYVLTALWDKDDNLMVVPMIIPKDADIYNAVDAYAKDSSQQVGDYVCSAYVTAQNLHADASLKKYMNEAIDLYIGTGLFERGDVVSDMMFRYESNTSVDYSEVIGKKADDYVGFAVVLSVLSGLIVGAATFLLVKSLKQTAAPLPPYEGK